jgi:biotin-[acetyl-CoA-carboxylase] ligase BirA-like protein
MKHHHFKQLDSTQLHLKNNFDELSQIDKELLVTCDLQTAGIGRSENTWVKRKNSISLSCTLSPNNVTAITPLEVAVMCQQFFAPQKIQFKWPNDLFNHNREKIGGIICQLISPETVIIGIGINLGQAETLELKNSSYQAGVLYPQKDFSDGEIVNLSKKLYLHFLKNRITALKVKELWESGCLHLNQKVKIDETSGYFKGINSDGQALLEVSGEIKKITSGNLSLLSFS